MKTLTFISGVLVMAAIMSMAGGCMMPQIPIGNVTGKGVIVAVRRSADRDVKIVGVPTAHHVFMPMSPEGPQPDYVSEYVWSFSLEDEKGQRKPLPFLQLSGGNSVPWDIITPMAAQDQWLAVVYFHSGKPDTYSYRVVTFTDRGVVKETTLDYPDYGKLAFDEKQQVLTYTMKSGVRTYVP